MPVLVTGMRSGTSMVMRLLNLCGVHIGDRLLGPAAGNPAGYWEDRELVLLDQELLAAMGGHTFGPPEYRDPPGALRRRALEIVGRLSAGGEPWGMKDPRLCLLLPFWLDLLPEAKVVFCLRHPHEVAASLLLQNGVGFEQGLSLWDDYNRRVFIHHDKLIITRYDSYLVSPQIELRRVLKSIGLPYNDGVIEKACTFVRPELRHFNIRNVALNPAMNALYQELCARSAIIAPAEAGP